MDVILKSAISWVCPSCNNKNFAELEKADLPPEEREEIYRELKSLEPWEGLPDGWEDDGIVAYPAEVTCGKCLTEYTVTPVPEDDDDDTE